MGYTPYSKNLMLTDLTQEQKNLDVLYAQIGNLKSYMTC